MPDPETIAEYRDTYDNWQKQLMAVHSLLIDGVRIPRIQIKGLLNREARWKRRYDRARLKLWASKKKTRAWMTTRTRGKTC